MSTTRPFTVVMAQLNFVVGAIDDNTTLLIDSARRAIAEFNAQFVIFPELTLTSYPPEDLLLRPSLAPRMKVAMDRILAAKLPTTLVFGYPESSDGKLYNSLAVVDHGKLLATYRKQCLPNYQVFDERRYFQAGNQPCVLEIHGLRLGFTICEDLWEEMPTQQFEHQSLDLLLNINASPFHRGKACERRQLLKRRAQAIGAPIAYVNLVGGQDELVFDGGSLAVDSVGNAVVQAPQFEAGLYPAVFKLSSSGRYEPARVSCATQPSDLAQVYKALTIGVRDYVTKNGFKGVVLGLSGGIDSALTLAIAVDALGAHAVHAVMMPFEYTSQLSRDAAAEQAATLGVAYRSISIKSIYDQFVGALASEFEGLAEDVTEQNLQARCRGVLLMAISNKKGYLVLTTGNKSEIAVGYSTLYGDMAGGFDVLKDVSKTLVYELSKYRNELGGAGESGTFEAIPQRVIDRPPSAELAPGQVDQDNLPPYDILDRILELYIEEDASASAIVAEGFDEQLVRRVLRLVDVNEYKRRQSPTGVRLTRRGFGRDRRYPITNGWPIGG
ncbi:NAD+ synthase [Gammaproteobacteria bacterium]|jgi:NAD+ synthase (glutamine-hydrolysing)|nr:NAD+ synthase [Gammaproteobacteria bacterium]MDA7781881.1 NAD+ synthase [Gammaproteobacteria bacterium]MDA9784467.1 NAD+ synthase [Gammaproteobacteria bacterium]MDB4165340.1 NAD+ synthase [Gammaproteobacteria bacterium]MDC1422507.1 NAD+ synthase [Gammaproteobacteria bacterium]